ncbi:Transposase [Thorsellia anophelis DSM 18579]|uniref:Transposase n=1 Tax=Thorsellia anophelis DSM 18579 TaxID=1123402 RepID=A0A1I0FVC9_9GAMM|nr:Transposase [Thorsellia anophelis DSM 18579]
MYIPLTDKEKSELLHQHAKTRDKRVCDRIKAVIHASNGWSVREISTALLISEASVLRHIQDYLNEKKLKPENGGSESKLTPEQTRALIHHLTETTYVYNHQIIAHVKATFGVQYTVPGMHKWLKAHGFTYKKPKGLPAKANPEAQQHFIEHYTALKSNHPNEVILFMDAVHPTQGTKLSYGWIKKGTDKFVKTHASRTRINLVGALNLANIAETVTRTYDAVNSESIVRFWVQYENSIDLSNVFT